jgi:hypothetical protein
MRRRIFTLASCVSLVLCLATILLRIRSSEHRDEVYLGNTAPDEGQSPTVFGIMSKSGTIFLVAKTSDTLLPELNVHLESWPAHPEEDSPEWRREHIKFGFGMLSYASSPPGSTYHQLLVRHWCLAALFLVLPVSQLPCLWHILKLRAARRSNRCVVCGYDLL